MALTGSLCPSVAAEAPRPAVSGSDAAIAGQKAYERGDDDAALDLFMRAAKSTDLSARQKAIALNDCGIIFERHKRVDEAKANYSAAISADANYAPPYYARANIESDAGQYDLAIADYSAAITLVPGDYRYYYSRSVAYDRKGENRLALADDTTALKLNPYDPSVFSGRAIVLAELGELDAAIADLDSALRLNPGLVEAYVSRGEIYRMKHKYDAALADFGKAVALQPDYPEAYINRGVVYFALAEYAEAARDVAVYRKARPTNVYGALWLHLANVKLKISDVNDLTARASSFVITAKWPRKILELFIGRATEDDVIVALREPDAGANNNPVCIAPFYLGEYELERGNVEGARSFFRQVASDNCRYGEEAAASEELARLPVKSDKPG